MPKQVLSTPSVSCMSCAGKIEDALDAVQGVESADVDIELKQVDVSYDEELVTLTDIIGVLGRAGYEAQPVGAA